MYGYFKKFDVILIQYINRTSKIRQPNPLPDLATNIHNHLKVTPPKG